jgi:hypothetical protein
MMIARTTSGVRLIALATFSDASKQSADEVLRHAKGQRVGEQESREAQADPAAVPLHRRARARSRTMEGLNRSSARGRSNAGTPSTNDLAIAMQHKRSCARPSAS